MMADWVHDARVHLLKLRGVSGAWGYRRDTSPAVEPTSLAALALRATGGTREEDARVVNSSAAWLASIQGRDGSLGVTAALPTPGWATPYAMMVWATLGGYESARRRAARWLLDQRGDSLPLNASDPVGHDTSIVGWSWLAGTHSWLEPTALGVLMLRAEGYADHPRVLEGLRLISNRAIPSGGWNYGNNFVFGKELRPQPATTGLALLALSRTPEPYPIVVRAIQYLRDTLPEVRSALSLGWGILGLQAHQSRPVEADGWLSEAYQRIAGHGASAMDLAILLVAAVGLGKLGGDVPSAIQGLR